MPLLDVGKVDDAHESFLLMPVSTFSSVGI